jgi:hypothetical protein
MSRADANYMQVQQLRAPEGVGAGAVSSCPVIAGADVVPSSVRWGGGEDSVRIASSKAAREKGEVGEQICTPVRLREIKTNHPDSKKKRCWPTPPCLHEWLLCQIMKLFTLYPLRPRSLTLGSLELASGVIVKDSRSWVARSGTLLQARWFTSSRLIGCWRRWSE